MNDECMNCTVRGDLDACIKTPCSQHKSWYVQTLTTKIKEALAKEKALQALHDENERLGLYKDVYAQPEQEPVPLVVSTAPKTIWLDLGFDPQDEDEISFKDLDEVTWSGCNASGYGIEYVRADTAPPQPSVSVEQEPVAWRVRWPKMGGGYAWVMNDAPLMAEHGFVNEPLYTTPPYVTTERQRTWVGLTDEQIDEAWSSATGGSIVTDDMRAFARTIYSIKE